MSTVVLNIGEAKPHLPRHVAGLKGGDYIILSRRDQPVADIRPLSRHPDEPRPVGLGRDPTHAFFDPPSHHILNDFAGGAG